MLRFNARGPNGLINGKARRGLPAPSCKPAGSCCREWHHPRGTRPSLPKDRGATPAYIYGAIICGAICPAEGKGEALVLPRCNTKGMTLRLTEISAAVAPGAQAIPILGHAG